MKAFAEGFEEELVNDAPPFFPTDDEGKPHRIIDFSVYTKNRVLRTPLSCKLSDETQTLLKLLSPWHGQSNLKEAFVTNVLVAGARIFTVQDISRAIPSAATSFTGLLPAAGAKRKTGANTSRARGGTNSQTAQAPVPVYCRYKRHNSVHVLLVVVT
jgi:hypothetical protein